MFLTNNKAHYQHKPDPKRLERSEPFGVKEEQSLFCSSVCRSYKIDAAKKGPRASPAKRVAWGKGAAVEHEKALAFARALESRNLPRRGGQREIALASLRSRSHELPGVRIFLFLPIKNPHLRCGIFIWRTEGDSNSRYAINVHTISNRAP